VSIRVTAVDLETGHKSEAVIQDGNYVLITSAPCYLDGEQHHANGTTVLTVKGRKASLMTTRDVVPRSTP
jgi:hypothetical protein